MDVGKIVKQQLESIGLDEKSDVVVAVSGGVDSLALWHMLVQGAGRWRGRVWGVHVLHLWPTDEDEVPIFLEEMGARWSVPLAILSFDAPARAAERGESLEEASRHGRYNLLARYAQEKQAAAVITAHHADDQAETVLMHLIRGAGLNGLAGMRPKGVVPCEDELDIMLARPLLTVPKAALRAYCDDYELKPLEDEMNQDVRFRRNRIRHQLLPLLADYNPEISRLLGQTATIVAADVAWLEAETAAAWLGWVQAKGAGWVRWSRAEWCEAPLALRRRSLRYGWEQVAAGGELAFKAVELARSVAERGQVGGEVDLGAGVQLRVEYESLLLLRSDVEIGYDGPQLVTAVAQLLGVPGELRLAGGWRLEAKWALAEAALVNDDDPFVAWLALAPDEQLLVRGRRAGERMRPLGMGGQRVRLKKVMGELR
ncbi:MAG TPA: tRNA lysidine(34) synthetase TilS, partial [Anaerolineae bacterium]|nr:tRNA lysidine(34) synthetase TilS [Anaerolineae bacterium]